MTPILLVGIPAAWLAWHLADWIRQWAVLDLPNERSSHTQPTPRGGGLAIVLVTLEGWLVIGGMLGLPTRLLLGVALGVGLVAAVSWLDDLRGLPARLRLGAHALAALLAVTLLGGWQEVALPGGTLSLGWLGVPITLLWLIGLTNAYNFMDGIDGLAGGQAVIAGAAWAAWGLWQGEPALLLLGTLLASSSLGFLGHNWPPARLFMGDVGSAFLGYSFALLPLIADPADGTLPVLAALLLWPFLFDTTLTLLRRLRQGENLLVAHRRHLYQRLVQQGHSHRTVTRRYLGLAGVGVVAAAAWSSAGTLGQAALLAGIAALALAHGWDVARGEGERPVPPAPMMPLRKS